MSESTAVAPAEETTQAPVEQATTETPVESVDNAEAAADATPAVESPDASEETEDLDFDLDKELSAALGTDISAEGVPEQEPTPKGRTQAEIEHDAFTFVRTQTNQLLQNNQNPFQQKMRDQLGIEAADADAFWRDSIRPLLQNAAYLPQTGVNQLFVEDLRASLEPEDFEALFADGRRYSGRTETLSAAIDKVNARKEAEFAEKVKKGEFVPRKTVKELTDTAAQRAEARTAKAIREGTYQSGQRVEGQASRSRGPLTKEEAETLPPEELRRRLGR